MVKLKKIIYMFVLAFSFYSLVSLNTVSANSDLDSDKFESIIRIDSINKDSSLEPLKPIDDIITPYYISWEVTKPIKSTGFIPSEQLVNVINSYERQKSIVEATNALGSLVNGATGVADSLISIFSVNPSYNFATPTGIDRMKTAYNKGQDLYFVKLYANGIKPSLSIEVAFIYSSTPITFVQVPKY